MAYTKILSKNITDWETFTGLNTPDGEQGISDWGSLEGAGYNWMGMDTARPLMEHKNQIVRPFSMKRDGEFISNTAELAPNQGGPPEMGIGESPLDKKEAAMACSQEFDYYFGDSSGEEARGSYEYFAFLHDKKWHFFAVYEFMNYGQYVYPYPVIGITFRLTVGKSKKSTTITGNCSKNHGDESDINVVWGCWQEKTGNKRWFYKEMRIKGYFSDNRTIYGSKGNWKLHGVSPTATNKQPSHNLGNDSRSHLYLRVRNEDWDRCSNAWFRGFCIQQGIPKHSAWHCHTHQISRLQPVLNTKSHYYDRQMLMPAPSVDSYADGPTYPFSFQTVTF